MGNIDVCVVDVQKLQEPSENIDELEWRAEARIIESIKQKLQEPSENKQMNNNSFTILRVDSKLRYGNEDVYTPQLVSIGPYHYGNVKFKGMQDVKYEYFNDLIQRSSKDPDPVPQYVKAVSKKAGDVKFKGMQDVKYECFNDLIQSSKDPDPVPQYVKAVSKKAAEAKKLYLGTDNLNQEQFVEMMVVDGCFLIEFLLKSYLNDKKDQTDIVKTKMSQLMNDLLLVENQIPFFILQDLLKVYCKLLESKEDHDNSPITIEVLALFCFTGDRLAAQLAAKLFEEEKKTFHHLLHLNHSSLNPNHDRSWKQDLELERVLKGIFGKYEQLNNCHDRLCTSALLILIILPVLIISLVKTSWSIIKYFMRFVLSKLWEWIMKLLLLPLSLYLRLMRYISFNTVVADVQWTSGIPNARYLRDTGFKFSKKDTSCLLDVSRSGRTIKIPRLCIQKTTIVQFKNLIALEYSCPKVYGNEFTAYAKFLDYLIDADEDVAILRECDIIDNRLEKDAEVATFFNNLLKGIDVKDEDIQMFPFIKKYYTGGIGYYKVRFFKWRKKLVPEYFSNPWAVPSMIAAFILLVLTVLQTFFTIYPYYKPR